MNRNMTLEGVVAYAFDTAEARGDCLLATAWKPQPKGYIRMTPIDDRRSGQMLHRLVVELREGRRLSPAESVDHTCHNADETCPGGPACWHRRCINPEHLEVTDPVTNWSRGRQGVQPLRRAKTHCPNNHPYDAANLRASANGWRACKACHRAKQAGRDPALEPTYL